MVSWKLEKKKKGLTVTWLGLYELFKLYENGSAKLKDLQGLELHNRVNWSKMKKYQVRDPHTQNPNHPEYDSDFKLDKLHESAKKKRSDGKSSYGIGG